MPGQQAEFTIGDGSDLLEEAAIADQLVELHYQSPDYEFIAARARIRCISGQQIYLDTPQGIHHQVEFAPGWQIDVYVSIHRRLYTFRSQVVQTRCQVTLRDGLIVQCIQITKPSSVQPGQRRQDFRVSLVSIDPIFAHIHEVAGFNPDAAPVGAWRMRAQLVNLSTGGSGLITNAPQQNCLQPGSKLFVGFELPVQTTAFIFQAQLAQVHSVLDGDGTRLGLRFLKWPNQTQYGRMMRPLERFIAQMQRTSARRTHRQHD